MVTFLPYIKYETYNITDIVCHLTAKQISLTTNSILLKAVCMRVGDQSKQYV